MAAIIEKNKALVRRWFKGHEQGMLDFGLCTPDFVDHTALPGLPPGIEGFKVEMEMFHKLAELWSKVNTLGMLEQLGVIPSQQARLR